MKRRKFIEVSSLVAGGLALGACGSKEKPTNKTETDKKPALSKPTAEMGLQLYTIRDVMTEKPAETLAAVSAMGYGIVENAGYKNREYYGMKPKAFKKMLDDNGLKMPSNHFGTGFTAPEDIGTLNNNFEALLEDAAFMGHKYVVQAWLHPDERKSIDDYKRLNEQLQKAVELAKKYDITVAYHNHEFEYEALDGQMPVDLLAQVEGMAFELDLYWITFAGKSPLDYIEKFKGRAPLWHVKDMKDKKFTEVGNGIIDFEAIFKQSTKSGLRYFFVEQDSNWTNSPMESAQTSHTFIKQNLISKLG